MVEAADRLISRAVAPVVPTPCRAPSPGSTAAPPARRGALPRGGARRPDAVPPAVAGFDGRSPGSARCAPARWRPSPRPRAEHRRQVRRPLPRLGAVPLADDTTHCRPITVRQVTDPVQSHRAVRETFSHRAPADGTAPSPQVRR
ncbi:hypothetical protein [Streptomyces sp. NRRL S-1896]|uniref:hypothetical protein n=1 Tax=Streptomyces sp. NRRL S-1896 TaxID=1463893 RepID=UPI0004CCFA46|nr:hypothetical protein [Streptomyces sp. NRRL S-1896]KOX01637.1 hypothetical protein ADL02_02265 [Streptomyces sp. NRRL WC-3723]